MSYPTQTTSKTTDLKDQLAQIGLLALAETIEDFLARATKARLSPRQIVEEIARLEITEGARRSLERPASDASSRSPTSTGAGPRRSSATSSSARSASTSSRTAVTSSSSAPTASARP